MKRFLNHPWLFWLILALSSMPAMLVLGQGGDAEKLLHLSGEFAARFMIIAMMLTPLLLLCRSMNWRTGWVLYLIKRRRPLGVAAFSYGLLHTILYVLDVRVLQDMLAEFWALGIWTGWLAFVIFIPLALTSNQTSVGLLGRRWKSLHRWVYLAAVLTLIHWIFVHNNLGPALVNFVPLALLEVYRIVFLLNRRKQKSETLNP
ncbi:MAG: sulfoxide reductase heme-binding subunit YedZ [Parasphingorhabdus sp.]|jgi:sulfoxide reductase heme-binding subunit YedZ